MCPRAQRKSVRYAREETRSVSQNQTYSPPSRSPRKVCPIQHQYGVGDSYRSSLCTAFPIPVRSATKSQTSATRKVARRVALRPARHQTPAKVKIVISCRGVNS
jgi:hypothetical protein